MQYVITVVLTLILSCSIIVLVARSTKNIYNKKIYRQSDMHNLLKIFFASDIYSENSFSSQIKKREENKTTKVVILEDKAYWVVDNIFYVGVAVDGQVRPETGIPIDTKTLSNSELNKLLFILDNLKGGKNNDSGSTGNSRI